jgi:protein-L-isoaspartate(D-aspartate) O-methyltransferase
MVDSSSRVGYIQTPDDDLAFIYQDTLVALDAARGINIGQPSAHARWLDALGLREGETVLQVGTGTGYYTAILARLVGRDGRVHAFEIDGGLAERTKTNLKHLPQVDVQARSGIADDLPKVDAVYVCAGITQPSWSWLDALKPNGRLVFPLHAVGGVGGMLMIRWPGQGAVWPARFISPAAFISCTGPRMMRAAAVCTQPSQQAKPKTCGRSAPITRRRNLLVRRRRVVAFDRRPGDQYGFH